MEGLKELYQQAKWPKPDAPRPMVMTNETIFNLTKAPKLTTTAKTLLRGIIKLQR
jgi:hypothetical protein